MIRSLKNLRPLIDPSAYVDQSAQVIGDVVVGKDSSIWMNVVIRGDVNHIRIGARSNIQDLTMVDVPARSLVMGRPGKVKRALIDEEVAKIRWYAENYVAYRLEYMR